ncbi:MAG TPA: hypothetical protein VFW90_01020 [Candidatus Saccharimonadales bacterium]|nr:hypothetical protein [Candidatus Saccharimonadales bacterium]
METPPAEELFDDVGLADRANEVLPRHGLVRSVIFEAKDIVLGGFNYAREHPIGSIEVGGALAATGVAMAAVIAPRLRHA